MRSHPHLERPGLPILGMVSQAGMCVMASCRRFLASVGPNSGGKWMCTGIEEPSLTYCCPSISPQSDRP